MTLRIVSSNDNPQPAAKNVSDGAPNEVVVAAGPDFKDVHSLGDVRSDITGRADQWSPRDVLLRTLHDIDSGELNPDALIVCHATMADGIMGVGFLASIPTAMHGVGILEIVKYKLL